MAEMQHPLDVPMYLHPHTAPQVEMWIPHIILWIPAYLPDFGDASFVMLEDGTMFYLSYGTKRIYQEIERFYGIHEDYMRDMYILGQCGHNNVPLVVQPRGLSFFSFKSRLPRAKRDVVMGYVCCDSVRRLRKAPGRTSEIELTNGMQIPTLMGQRTLNQRRQSAISFQQWLIKHRGFQC